MSTVRIRVIVEAIEDVLAGKTMVVVILSGRGIGWRDVRSDCQFIDVVVVNRCTNKRNAMQWVAPREMARNSER